MKQVSFWCVLSLLMPVWVNAQSVPDKILNMLIKTYTEKGMKLERSFLPDFKRAHPCNMMYYTNCYRGKKVVVATILAGKPSDWYFKVSYGSQVAPKTHQLGEETLDGKPYWLDWILTGFPSSFSDASENCLTIVAYDKNAIDLPVYMYIFTKPLQGHMAAFGHTW